MGSLTWHGWQASLVNAHGTTGIIYGGNLRKRPSGDEGRRPEQSKDDKQKENDNGPPVQ